MYGRPPLSFEGTATISVKMSAGMNRAVERKAREAGMSMSAYTRAALATSCSNSKTMLALDLDVHTLLLERMPLVSANE